MSAADRRLKTKSDLTEHFHTNERSQVGRRYRLQWYSGQEDGSKSPSPNRFPGTGLAAIDVRPSVLLWVSCSPYRSAFTI